jgi:hypothetical protein
VNSETGWGYHYTKRIALRNDPPGFVIDHLLSNTGERTIETDQYNHNFFMIDGQATGPDFTVEFPFEITLTEGLRDAQHVLRTEGNQVNFNHRFSPGGSAWVELFGYSTDADDHQFRVYNEKTGAGVLVTVDRPVHRMTFWATQSTLCPENFLYLKIEPGEEEQWRSDYALLTL